MKPATETDGHDEPAAWDRTHGTALFTADVASRTALHAAFAVSMEPRARIRSIDTSQALALPGVVAVLTGQDIGEHRLGRSLRDYPVLAVDRVLFTGQRVAAVAAWDVTTAREAADLIDIDYEPLPALLDAEAAAAADAPELHPDYHNYAGSPASRGGTNVQGGQLLEVGDTDPAFAECDSIHEHTFRLPRMHSAPLEPHGCLVEAGENAVHVHAAHKEPYKLRRDLALVSGRPQEDFVIHPVSIGGDFGAKGFPFVEATCYFLSVETGRPVRAILNYFEELTTTTSRHAGTMRLRTGLRRGRIHAHQAETLLDGGAFAGPKPRPTLIIPVVGVPLAPYAPPNRYERSVSMYTNNLPAGQVRSPGEFQATFVGESHVDVIAREHDEDPIEFRLRHSQVPEATKVLEEIRTVVAGWRSELAPETSTSRGIGVSVFHRGTGAGRSVVTCDADERSVRLSVGAPDQGAGSYVAFQRMVADVLGVPVGAIEVRGLGADPSLMDSGAGASRVTAVAGRACVEAARALLQELGRVPSASEEPSYWIGEQLAELGRASVHGRGEWNVPRGATSEVAAAHGSLAIDLTVDEETGVLDIHRAALVVDAGPVMNPLGHRGQLEGGFVYGLSQTLFEELVVEDGQVVTASLGDYKLASAGDVPPLEIRILPPELDEGADPYEAIRGVGELGNLGVAPAVANAVHDAVGVRILELPITADRIWSAIHG